MHRITHVRRSLLSAGAIGSPQILKLSGLGPATELAQHGIDVVRDIPDVGENLQDHLQLRCSWALQGAKTLNTMANSWLGKAQIALEYALKRSGPMSMAPSQLGAFAKSRAGLDTPDLEFHVQPYRLRHLASLYMITPQSPHRFVTCGPPVGGALLCRPGILGRNRKSSPIICPRKTTVRWPPMRLHWRDRS
jgi:choline dehydrogenase-like flavoprotein